MSELHRAAEVVSFFEAVVRRLRAQRSGDDLAIAEAAFAAVYACYPTSPRKRRYRLP